MLHNEFKKRKNDDSRIELEYTTDLDDEDSSGDEFLSNLDPVMQFDLAKYMEICEDNVNKIYEKLMSEKYEEQIKLFQANKADIETALRRLDGVDRHCKKFVKYQKSVDTKLDQIKKMIPDESITTSMENRICHLDAFASKQEKKDKVIRDIVEDNKNLNLRFQIQDIRFEEQLSRLQIIGNERRTKDNATVSEQLEKLKDEFQKVLAILADRDKRITELELRLIPPVFESVTSENAELNTVIDDPTIEDTKNVVIRGRKKDCRYSGLFFTRI